MAGELCTWAGCQMCGRCDAFYGADVPVACADCHRTFYVSSDEDYPGVRVSCPRCVQRYEAAMSAVERRR